MALRTICQRVNFKGFTKLLNPQVRFSYASSEQFLSTHSLAPRILLSACPGNHQERRQWKSVNVPLCYRYLATGLGTNEPKKKPSLYQRFKLMYKEYWYVLLPVHVVTSAFWLGGFYYLAVSGVDIATLLEVIGAPETWVLTIRESKAGGIVTAYTMYKVATPARYTVTLGGTTVSINYLKKWGWIKPIPSTEELKTIYEDRKTALKEKVTATTDEIKDEFAKTKDEITQHMKEAKTGFKQSVNETKDGFKEGVREAADEWRHVGKLVKRNVKEIMKPQKENNNK